MIHAGSIHIGGSAPASLQHIIKASCCENDGACACAAPSCGPPLGTLNPSSKREALPLAMLSHHEHPEMYPTQRQFSFRCGGHAGAKRDFQYRATLSRLRRCPACPPHRKENCRCVGY